jgi:hypothetical protein
VNAIYKLTEGVVVMPVPVHFQRICVIRNNLCELTNTGQTGFVPVRDHMQPAI